MATLKKLKMCKNKMSFRTKSAALKVADKHQQRVYECPICFCFHCTSKPDWRDEFVSVTRLEHEEKLNRALSERNKSLVQKNHNLRQMNDALVAKNRKLQEELTAQILLNKVINRRDK